MKTYAEWHEAGFLICKGAKSVARNEHGVAMFSEDQVRRPSRLHSRSLGPSPFYNTSPTDDFEDEGDSDYGYIGMDYSDFGNN